MRTANHPAFGAILGTVGPTTTMDEIIVALDALAASERAFPSSSRSRSLRRVRGARGCVAEILQKSARLEREIFGRRVVADAKSACAGRIVGRSLRGEPAADEHEAICVCGCQDRTGARGFDAAFGMFASTA